MSDYNSHAITEETLGQIDARLNEIDELLFKGATGQVPMSFEERTRLEGEAERIMTTIANTRGRMQMVEPSEIYKMRTTMRYLKFQMACIDRHKLLHPLIDEKIVSSIRTILDPSRTDDDETLMAAFNAHFAYMFVQAPEPKPKSFFKRFFGKRH